MYDKKLTLDSYVQSLVEKVNAIVKSYIDKWKLILKFSY